MKEVMGELPAQACAKTVRGSELKPGMLVWVWEVDTYCLLVAKVGLPEGFPLTQEWKFLEAPPLKPELPQVGFFLEENYQVVEKCQT